MLESVVQIWPDVAAGLLEEPQGGSIVEMSEPTQDSVPHSRPISCLTDVTAAVSAVTKSVLGFLPDAKQVWPSM